MRRMLVSAAFCVAVMCGDAAIKTADPFADGMVLQRDRLIPVWGTGEPSEKVSVAFAGQTVEATTGKDGRWMLRLQPMPACREGRRMVVTDLAAKTTKTFDDVLVGDVWFVSGQSNTEFPLCGGNPHFSDRNGAAVASITHLPLVRYCRQSSYRISVEPKTAAACPVSWLKFEPDNLINSSFSAIGVYFALYVHQATGIPLGLVGTYWGGTGIDPWTPREGTATRPDLKDIYDWKPVANWDGKNPKSIFRHNRNQDQPAVLWNDMVNPWCPYAMKGMLWYQGCTDSREPERYCSKMHALYNGWSSRFGNPEMKLYFVQLAPWGFAGIAAIQEAQADFEREQPNSGMAVINDIGNLTDIHPNEKGTVGLRLARMALKRDYGFADIEERSPQLANWKIEGDQFVLDFSHAKSLYIYNRDFSTITPFEVAGEDGVFKPAQIENLVRTTFPNGRKEYRGMIKGGARLVVKAKGVEKPCRLRYCHSSPWLGTVYNEVNLPLGAFHIDAGSEHHFYISNHDQSPSHRVIHPLIGLTNFVYDAKGAMEKIRGEAIAFYVKDCENVTIKNLRLDWERPCMTEAKITGFENGETMVEIDRNLFPVTFKDGRLWMCGPGWTNETRYCRLFDGRTREQIPESKDVGYNGTARELSDGRIALKYDFSKCGAGMREGDIIVFRPHLRPCPAIVVYDSKNTVLEDVVIHDAYGMALIAQRSENVVWRGTKTAADKTSGVFPRLGCYASTHADASHFSNVKGQVTVENCWFEGMMDDSINVHSTCLAVTNVVSANRIRCRYMHHQAVGFEVFKPGEMLRFINGRTLENGPEVKISAVEMHDEREVTLTLAEPIPTGWGAGDAVENADYQCAATFRGNVVCNNRARGTLFTTPYPVLVESNLFDRVTGAPLLFAGDDYYWYESGACRDVVVRGNVFSNCYTSAGGYSKGILSFYPVVRDCDAQKNCYHGNILVEDNVFTGFDSPLMFAMSVENLVWRNNRTEYNDLYRGCEEPPFVFRHCRNITIDGRKCPDDTRMDTGGRVECDFNEDWEFRKETETAWRSVRLPHDWAAEGEFDRNGEPGAGRLPYAGTGWYRKRFTLPDDAIGQSVFLDVGGAMTESDVYLNGVRVGGRMYGFSSFRVNLTAAIREPGQPNELMVRCHVPAKSARFYFGAGLYRGIRLVRTAPIHVGYAGVTVTTKLCADGSADVSANVDVKGPMPFIRDPKCRPSVWGGVVTVTNRVIGESGMKIRKPKLWSPETPNLYTLETVVYYAGREVDRVTTRFGVRTLKFDSKRGFFLNGKHRQMKGVCLHHDLGPLGAAFHRGAFERQVKIMKEMGADAIRTSHNPPAREVLDVCDEMGMMVMDEAFDTWNRHKYPADYATHFDVWSRRDLADFIRRDRNHPSVVMWSVGNEIPGTLERPRADEAAAIGRSLTQLCHKLDPTRLTTMGHCRSWAMTNGMAAVTDVFGANYLPQDYAWYLANGEGEHGLIATETCSAVSTRGLHDDTQFRKNNYQPEVEFKYQKENPACYGEFVWTGFDYLGEPDPYTKQGARSSYYGIVDLCGFPKDRYYVYQKQWNPTAPRTPEPRAGEETFGDLLFVTFAGEGWFDIPDREGYEFLGTANGDPMDYTSLKSRRIKAFHGLALAIYRRIK